MKGKGKDFSKAIAPPPHPTAGFNMFIENNLRLIKEINSIAKNPAHGGPTVSQLAFMYRRDGVMNRVNLFANTGREPAKAAAAMKWLTEGENSVVNKFNNFPQQELVYVSELNFPLVHKFFTQHVSFPNSPGVDVDMPTDTLKELQVLDPNTIQLDRNNSWSSQPCVNGWSNKDCITGWYKEDVYDGKYRKTLCKQCYTDGRGLVLFRPYKFGGCVHTDCPKNRWEVRADLRNPWGIFSYKE